MPTKPPGKKDPIRLDPLRDPGQSLREEINALIDDKVMAWIVVGLSVVVLAGMEWFRWAFEIDNSPLLVTFVCVGVLVFVAFRVRQSWKQLANLKLGWRGERRIGQFLQDELMPLGYRVFHDVCEDDYNIDHVLVGPTGLYAVETKTISKPATGPTKVTFEGETVLVNGNKPDRDPIVQSRGCAKRLREIIKDYTGEDVSVRPVVLYPGWFVEEYGNNTGVWVLHEERFLGYLRHESKRLDDSQVKFLAAQIAKYIRDSEAKRK